MADLYLSRADWGANTELPRLGHSVTADKRTELHVHHTAAVDASDQTKNRWSLENAIKYMRRLQTVRPDLGLDVPYTEVFFVLENLDVAVMEGRGLWRTGAHTKDHNTAGFGWSAAGNFDLNDPEGIDALIGAMDNRVRWLRDTSRQFPNLGSSHPDGRLAFGHRDTKTTACPGSHLFAEIHRIGATTPQPPAPQPPPPSGTPVMGQAEVSLGQAIAFVTSRSANADYPTDTVRNIVETTWRIAESDGVRADLAIALMCKETGFFHFGGDVKAHQWNFGGIGATGGVPGLSFPTLEAGVKAVVRRMRMYAVHDRSKYDLAVLGRSLPEVGVPEGQPGFKGWGKHPNIEDFNGAWAVPGDGYGESIVRMVELMKQTPVPSEPSSPFTDEAIAWLDNRYERKTA